MLRDMLSGHKTENNENRNKENRNNKPSSTTTNLTRQKPDQKLGGEEFNVINHEDVEDGTSTGHVRRRLSHDDIEKLPEEAKEEEEEAEEEDEDEEDEDEDEGDGGEGGEGGEAEEEEAEDDDEEQSFYRSGLAGLLGGRMMLQHQHSGGNTLGRKVSAKFDHLHPFTQVLSVSNVEDCVQLEEEAFPEEERCTREKFIYRLSTCPELGLGLFSRPTLSEISSTNKTITYKAKHRLIAHIISTRTPSRTVTDASMSFPSDWKNRRSSLPRAGEPERPGHQEQGGTIALHSLAVVGEHQRKGLGTVLLKAYIERMKSAKIAERISLLAHEHMVKFYEGFGFVDEGPSEATFGGGNWNSMVLEFGDEMDD